LNHAPSPFFFFFFFLLYFIFQIGSYIFPEPSLKP
jgi:hypothetical protein